MFAASMILGFMNKKVLGWYVATVSNLEKKARN